MGLSAPDGAPAAGIDYAPLPVRAPEARFEFRVDGSILIEPGLALPELWPSIPHLFQTRAREHGDRAFVARRTRLPDGGLGDWRKLTYAGALAQARSVAQAFLDLGLGPEASVMVLSGASPEHMVISLAAQMARAPYAPISDNYSLRGDFERLRLAFEICRPKLIFADDWRAFLPAMRALAADGVRLVTLEPAPDGETLGLAQLLAVEATQAVDRSMAAIMPGQHAKTIFTSGSTGRPKGVMQTQRMLTGVVAQHDALYLRGDEHGSGEAYLSWVPWSHVGANNTLFADVINDAATLYIDDGRPLPGQFDETIRNLREIHPREYASTPIFFSALVSAMEADAALRDGFFSRLRLLSYGTAGLSQDVFRRLQALAVSATGRGMPMISKYGATETQGATLTYRPLEQTGAIGLPFPGISIKLAPVGAKLELRIKGPLVTPGYLANPEATAAAFDDEGYYRTGDAAQLADRERPELGLVFDGRIVENFKLTSGTWVHVGNLRLSLIAALSPVVQDLVVAGEGREWVAILAWLRPREARQIAGDVEAEAAVAAAPGLRRHLLEALRAFNAEAGGQSRRVARMLVLVDPPAGDEMADKGYINQRAVLERRRSEVERLYAREPDPDVIVC